MIAAATIQAQININQTTTSGTAGILSENVLNGSQPLFTFTNGTGTGQCDTCWSASTSLASTTVTYNLQSLTNLLGSISFARVKMYYIQNLATIDGYDLIVGGAGTHPWLGFMTGNETIPAGGIVLRVAPLATDFLVTSTSCQLELNSGSNTVPFKLVLLGSSV